MSAKRPERDQHVTGTPKEQFPVGVAVLLTPTDVDVNDQNLDDDHQYRQQQNSTMEDAWQSQESNTAISIPNDAALNNGSAMVTDDQGYGGRSPNGERAAEPPRRSSRSRSPGANRDERGGNPGNNLHVSGLTHRVDNRDLEAAFSKVGRVKKAAVMYDPHTRESRGFGFVTMESGEEAEAAVAALNNTELMGKIITIEKARRGRARTPTPGRYYGPPKRAENERPYDPRPYDSRYARDYDGDRRPRDDRRGGGGGGGGRYDDYRGGGRGDYDRERDGGRYRDYDRDRDYDRRGGGGGGGGDRERFRDRRDDRRYDDRRY